MNINKDINILENKTIKASIYNFKRWIDITDPEILYNSLSRLLEMTGYHVLNHIEHHFPNGGYTCLWLLAESHLAAHTFIEDNKTYIELSGCNKEMNDKFIIEFDNLFKNSLIKTT